MDNEHNLGTPEWYAAMDRLGRKYTGWNPLEQMCMNTPTLRRLKRMRSRMPSAGFGMLTNM
jgi:hypothetical protein